MSKRPGNRLATANEALSVEIVTQLGIHCGSCGLVGVEQPDKLLEVALAHVTHARVVIYLVPKFAEDVLETESAAFLQEKLYLFIKSHGLDHRRYG